MDEVFLTTKMVETIHLFISIDTEKERSFQRAGRRITRATRQRKWLIKYSGKRRHAPARSAANNWYNISSKMLKLVSGCRETGAKAGKAVSHAGHPNGKQGQ